MVVTRRSSAENDLLKVMGFYEYGRRVFLTALIVVLVVGGIYLLSHVVQVLLFVFGGVLVALFLHGIAQFIVRHTGLWPGVSLALVLLTLLALLAGVIVLAGPRLVAQADLLGDRLPKSIDAVETQLANHSWTRRLLTAIPSPQKLLSAPRTLIGGLPTLVSSATEAMALVALSIGVGIYTAANPDLYFTSLLHLVPPRNRPKAQQVVDRLGQALRWWLVGRLLTMTLMGCLTTLGLWIIGVPMAVTLGLIAGLFQFVPYLGALVAAVPALLIALIQSPGMALEVAFLYLGVHLVEGYCVTPLIQQRAVSLPPAVLICMQVIMAGLFGITGVIFATPVAVVIIVLVQTLYLKGVLDDQVEVLGQ